MQINRCPKCGQGSSHCKLFNIKFQPIGYEVECDDCGLHTGHCYTYEEAVAKWNELTNKMKGENR